VILGLATPYLNENPEFQSINHVFDEKDHQDSMMKFMSKENPNAANHHFAERVISKTPIFLN